MKRYVDPHNKDGFAKAYFAWVVKNWSEREFFDACVMDSGYDISYQPIKTDKLLSEEIETLGEFLAANNGNSYATYCSGSGMACEEISEEATEFFREACINEIDGLIFLLGSNVIVPEYYQEEAETLRDLFVTDIIDARKHPELYVIINEIYTRYAGLTMDFYDIYNGIRYLELTLPECRDRLGFYNN